MEKIMQTKVNLIYVTHKLKRKRRKPDIHVRSFLFKGELIKVTRSSYVRANEHNFEQTRSPT